MFALAAMAMMSVARPAAAQNQCPSISIGGITFPAGTRAFADSATIVSGQFDFRGGATTLNQAVTGTDLPTNVAVAAEGVGKPLIDVLFTDNVIENGPGDDLVIFELDEPSPIQVSIKRANGTMTFFRSYTSVPTGVVVNTPDDGPLDLNKVLINLSDFGIPAGEKISCIRIFFDASGEPATVTVVGGINVPACDDGDPCTLDTCVNGVCVYTPIPGCGTGACCLTNGCTVVSQSSCTEQGGTFRGNGTLCTGNICDITGACCFGNGTCLVTSLESCGLLGGTTLGADTVCTPDACAATGACCFGNAPCQALSATACATAGCSYAGSGTLCATSCSAVGACCFGNAPCQQISASSCEAQNGTFLGAGIGCAQCVPTGACCLTTGCSVISQTSCAALGGTYRGNGTPCSANTCDITGACCFGNGTCLVTSLESCGLLGGTTLGADTVCTPDACAATGACCFGNAPCQALSATACATAGGSYAGSGTTCATSCSAVGACCFGNAPCQQISASSCEAQNGTFLGVGIGCAQCVPTGACCLTTGCSVISQTSCAALGGTYRGNGTPCSQCPPKNDCNANGVEDSTDITNGTSKDCNKNGVPDECEADTDSDGVIDACDNCPGVANPGQEDANNNGVGDVCEAVGQGVACCMPNGSCQNLATGDLCTAQGGMPGPAGSTCATTTCTPFCDPNVSGISVLFSTLFRAPVCGTGCPTFVIGSLLSLVTLRIGLRRRKR